MVDLYAKMGVENNTWPLVLLQPELKNIDPFSTNLSVEEMLMIRNECKNNPWYFLEK